MAKYKFIKPFTTEITVGGAKGISPATFNVGQILEGVPKSNLIEIRFKKHNPMNDTPSNMSYQETVMVPKEYLKLLDPMIDFTGSVDGSGLARVEAEMGKNNDYSILRNIEIDLNKAINDGTLSQSQANQIAQKIYKHNEFAKSAKFSQGYIPPTINWSAQLKKSGYEYKEVTASPSKGMMQVFTPAHGEAVKISSASATEPKPSTTSTRATTPTEESFFEKNKTAIIIVAGFALAGTAYYFYTKKKK